MTKSCTGVIHPFLLWINQRAGQRNARERAFRALGYPAEVRVKRRDDLVWGRGWANRKRWVWVGDGDVVASAEPGERAEQVQARE